ARLRQEQQDAAEMLETYNYNLEQAGKNVGYYAGGMLGAGAVIESFTK
ncbi:MAG: hypothetical protein GWN58_55470, partial [Anaerolineae bacterium]|nr:hypothetical protein [Anaerolineae bacterium]